MSSSDQLDNADFVVRMQGEIEAFISEAGYVVISERKPVTGEIESVAISPVFIPALIRRLKKLEAELLNMRGEA